MDARSWTAPHPPMLQAPDAFLYRRLLLTDVWRSDAGTWHAIAAEPSSSLWSILGYLRWHAPVVAAGDPASRDYADVDAYLESRPLVISIDAELVRRGESEPGGAMNQLRTLGFTPWELPRGYARRRASGR